MVRYLASDTTRDCRPGWKQPSGRERRKWELPARDAGDNLRLGPRRPESYPFYQTIEVKGQKTGRVFQLKRP